VKILVSWLREFVDVTDPPEALGHRLSMAGFELGAIEKGAGLLFRDGATKKEPGPVFEDAVLDFEITANRPDALSVIGLAREAATAYSLPLHQLGTEPLTLKALQKGAADVAVTLEAPDLCPRYAAAVVDVKIAPSPDWLAARLQACGVRPINNVVDVTNYVLLELGQPMHAFDLEKLAGHSLRIRRAARGERMKTLDGVERTLDANMLVIADAATPQAVAGVMGGGVSEVSAATKTVVLESACFLPKSVRATSKMLGLKTEASARFERGTDIDAPVVGIERAAALLEKIGAGKVRPNLIDEYPNRMEAAALTLRRARIERVLGQAIPDEDVERILAGLGFKIVRNAGGWGVTVPTFRVDISREVDLIEEVARHHGYDRLPATFPALEAPPRPPDSRIERDRIVRRVLLAAGCSEAVTFSFISAERAAPFADQSAIAAISNPLTTQFAVLRPSLVPGLLAALAHNRHREQADVRLFEIGAAITRLGQHRRAAVAAIGGAAVAHWSAPRRPVDFFDVKGLVERVGEALQLDLSFDAGAVPPYLVPGRAAVVSTGGKRIGAVGMLMPSIAAAADLAKDDVYIAELDVDISDGVKAPVTFKPLPRYPSIARDISIVVDDILPAASVRGTIRSAAPETLVSVREFDRYQGKGVPEGRVSLSLRLTFRSLDRTLTDSDVDAAMQKILEALKAAHDAVQR